MRFEPERAPHPRHERLRDVGVTGHRPGRPVRGLAGRGRLQRIDDDLLDGVVTDLAGTAHPRLVEQPVDAGLDPAAPPLAHRRRATTQPLRDRGIGCPLSRGQHDPCSQRQRLRHRVSPGPTLQHLPVLAADLDHRWRPPAPPARHRLVACVPQPCHATLGKPCPPLRHRRFAAPQLRGQFTVRRPTGRAQHDPGPYPLPLRDPRVGRHRLQRILSRAGDHHRHRPAPRPSHLASVPRHERSLPHHPPKT